MTFNLRETGYTDLMTSFRFDITISPDPANNLLGLTEEVIGYVTSSDLPSAGQDPIPWFLPGGMVNHQAGAGRVEPINVEFVVPSNYRASTLRLVEKWRNATYDLNRGTNAGKRMYCTDAISIRAKSEADIVQYIWRIFRAQIVKPTVTPFSSEGQDLLKVSFGLVYDLYEVLDGEGTPLISQTN